MLPNVLQYPVAMFGALRAGYTIVNCNPALHAARTRAPVVDSGAEVIVVLENFAATVQQVAAPRRCATSWSPHWAICCPHPRAGW
jgi:long-chain acyl-CoA synthetase